MLRIKKQYDFSKVGIDEIQGLKKTMMDIMQPVKKAIQDNIYWTTVELEETEYKSRDGFIPYSHNCGGISITEIIPECEKYDFDFLEFGEWDGEHYCDGKDTDNCECYAGADDEYDAKLRIWFKFEGVNDKGDMEFYLVLSGGNGDAPYFREQYAATIFEASFTAKNMSDLKAKSKKHIKALLKAMSLK